MTDNNSNTKEDTNEADRRAALLTRMDAVREAESIVRRAYKSLTALDNLADYISAEIESMVLGILVLLCDDRLRCQGLIKSLSMSRELGLKGESTTLDETSELRPRYLMETRKDEEKEARASESQEDTDGDGEIEDDEEDEYIIDM